MGSGNLTPLEELKSLDQRIEQIHSLAGLQPLFARLEEITKKYSGDFEVQLVAHDVKQHMLSHGSRIKQMQPPPVVVTSAPQPSLAAGPPPATSQPAKPGRPGSRKLARVFAALLLIAAIGIGFSVMRDRNQRLAQTTSLDAIIVTEPQGADIQINGQQTCKSDCTTKLVPGTYPVIASLVGYEPATSQLTVKAGQPPTLKLTLTPQAVSVRIFADLGTGQVFLDDKPAGELLDGQFTLEHVEPGPHTIRVSGGGSDATFSIKAEQAALPVVDGTAKTNNLLAILVANLGDQARVATSSGPLKLTLNGQTETDVTPEGSDLKNFHTGPAEFVVGEGTTQRALTGTFTSAPTVTAFLKTDQKIGTLIIATGEDDVRIFVNNKEQKRRTAKGQARVQTFGDVTVRVEKPGFDPVPTQTAKVAQGSEAKLTFTMRPTPKFASLSVSGAAPGTQVLLSDRLLGTVGNDGAFRNTTIPPGDYPVELHKDQFEPKRLTRTFRAGETVIIGVSDATLAAIKPPPPPVIAPPPPKPEPAPVKLAPRAPASGTIANFDNPGAWAQSEGVWRHRGAATLTYGLPPDGIFTFSIYMLKGGGLLRGGKVHWFLNYIDAKNYCLFELDEENFWAKVVENGKTIERKKVAHKQDKSMRVWNIQIDVNAQRAIHKIQGDNGWVDLDTWSDPGRDFTKGKFGVLANGSEEVGLSNFTFTGR